MEDTEDKSVFDLSFKKKKKKKAKKTTEATETQEEEQEKVSAPSPAAPVEAPKKKKKGVRFDFEEQVEDEEKKQQQEKELEFEKDKQRVKELEQEQAKLGSKKEESKAEEDEENTIDSSAADVDFGKRKKKKKKKKKEADEKEAKTEENLPQDGYTYNYLLDRIFDTLLSKNPDLVSRSRTTITAPQVFRDGTKKTVWANCQEMCDSMKRDSEHMLKFAKVELGTDISVDASKRLVIKGRFTPKQIETVVRNYFLSYVACKTCKGSETTLKKENRLYFVQCRSCGSIRSVESINKGFVAQVGRRKKEK